MEKPLPDDGLKFGDVTRSILACAFEVSLELGAGFLESVYEEAMVIALGGRGLSTERQVPVPVLFRGLLVGKFYPDLVVESKVIVELKAVRALVPEHTAQTINYLKATGMQVGMLLNFGNPRLEFKRLVRDDRESPPCSSVCIDEDSRKKQNIDGRGWTL